VGTKLNKSLEPNSTNKEFITAFNKIQKFIGSTIAWDAKYKEIVMLRITTRK
jgi:hypothetical protein